MHVPLALLPQVAAGGGATSSSWQVPGRREELVVALLRSLPKALRRSFTPPTTFAAEVLPELDPGEPLLDGLERALRRRTGITVAARGLAARQAAAATCDRPSRSQDDGGEIVATGKDLGELRTRLAPQVQAAVAASRRRTSNAPD